MSSLMRWCTMRRMVPVFATENTPEHNTVKEALAARYYAFMDATRYHPWDVRLAMKRLFQEKPSKLDISMYGKRWYAPKRIPYAQRVLDENDS